MNLKKRQEGTDSLSLEYTCELRSESSQSLGRAEDHKAIKDNCFKETNLKNQEESCGLALK